MRFAVSSIPLVCCLYTLVFGQTTIPTVVRKNENANQVGRYEKYEIVIELGHLSFTNPYNPEEIDVRALFTAPSGRPWTIYGFYDHDQNRNPWKLRFAANKVGVWTYQLSADTPGGDMEFQSLQTALHRPGTLRTKMTL